MKSINSNIGTPTRSEVSKAAAKVAARVAVKAVPAIGKTVETPKESLALAAEFAVKFTAATELWIIRGKSGQVRLTDKAVIAACLLSKAEKYPAGDSAKVRETLKGYRNTFSKLTAEKKVEWMNKAQKVFSPARREYHDVVKPLALRAVGSKQFTLERMAVSCTKSGIVHVASRATHRPE